MRICVVGCGAIGSLFAAHLGRLPEAEVWVFDVAEAQVRAINDGGLRLAGTGPVTSRVRARTDSGDIPPCQLGIVATKSRPTGSAMAATAQVFTDAAVCSVQNGVGNEEIIARHVPRVIRGTTIVAGRLPAPGVVHLDAPGDTWIGPFEPKPASMDEVRQLAGLLTRSGLRTIALTDSRGAQWTKLIFNAATSPVAALTGLTMGQLGDAAEARQLISGLAAEGCAVAAALGITLDDDPMALIDAAVTHARGHQPSMLQDALARRRTEIDVLNGGIVRAARETGVPTPLNQAVVALIDGLERSWT
ncbi:MAG: 2-dehydropantoate 2-reductase [Streptosporangiaceae bacterium]|jgi:2-dehydropantoate 2-reductase|nr:2-dehydropantoate 2-reductase [Streptosporangiaceae bacterium]